MRPGFRCLVILLGGLAVLVASAIVALVAAGNWLMAPDRPAKADAVIILSGDPARALYAADLYHNGIAERVLITRPVRLRAYRVFDDMKIEFPRTEDLYREVLIRKGVNAQHIDFIGESLVSTVDEAKTIKALVSSGKLHKLVLVTSPYHVRRVKMVFRDVVPEAEVVVVATPYELYPERWWADQDVARNVVLEIVKTVYYLLGGRFLSGGAS